MNILAAVRCEERKLEKELGTLNHKLDGVRAAERALGPSANRGMTTVKKRVLSEAGRAKISKAAKKRWAKIRAGAKKLRVRHPVVSSEKVCFAFRKPASLQARPRRVVHRLTAGVVQNHLSLRFVR